MISIINGCYTIKRKMGDVEFDFPITNFTIEILSNHHREGKILREIVLIKGNHRSRPILIEPEEQWKDFQVFLSSIGQYVWRGKPQDLVTLWEYLYISQTTKTVFEPDYIGMQNDGTFLFENIAIKDEKVIYPDNTGTFWDGEEGIKPRSLSISKTDSNEGLPFISTNTIIDINDIAERLAISIPRQDARIALSWCASVLYMDEVFEKFNCFPFLFITGKRRSGKTTIAEWLMYLFGFESAGRTWADTTPVGMSRLLSYYSNLPVWLDEYRNSARDMTKINILRNVYNKQSSGKGVKADFGVRYTPIRGTCLITGEETPSDSALLSRCISIELAESSRTIEREQNFNWFQANRQKLSNFTFQILRTRAGARAEYLSKLSEYKSELSKSFDERSAANNAVIAAGHFILFGEDIDFAKNLVNKAVIDRETIEEEAMTQTFFNDVAAMYHGNQLKAPYWAVTDEHLFIYFQGLYGEWAVYFKKIRGYEPFKLQSLRSYITQEPGFIATGINHRLGTEAGGSVRSCIQFDKNNIPPYIKQLIQ